MIEQQDASAQARHEPAQTSHGSVRDLLHRLRPEDGLINLPLQTQPLGIAPLAS
jgi:hypothetical protein